MQMHLNDLLAISIQSDVHMHVLGGCCGCCGRWAGFGTACAESRMLTACQHTGWVWPVAESKHWPSNCMVTDRSTWLPPKPRSC